MAYCCGCVGTRVVSLVCNNSVDCVPVVDEIPYTLLDLRGPGPPRP